MLLQVDYKILADKKGYNSAKAATGAFWKLKKKLQLDSSSGTTASTQAAPAEKAGRKRKARADVSDDGEEQTARGRKSKKARSGEGEVAIKTDDEMLDGNLEVASAAGPDEPVVVEDIVEGAGAAAVDEPGVDGNGAEDGRGGSAGPEDDEVADDDESQGDEGDIGLAMFG